MSNSTSYPVNAEIYSLLETVLLTQSKKLVEDIAKFQKSDSKDLWAQIRPQIRIGLVELNPEEEPPLYCSAFAGNVEGAIRQRCRAPCLIGFSACPKHVNMPSRTDKPSTPLTQVQRFLDTADNTAYFKTPKGDLIDKNGVKRGYYDTKQDTYYVFEVAQ